MGYESIVPREVALRASALTRGQRNGNEGGERGQRACERFRSFPVLLLMSQSTEACWATLCPLHFHADVREPGRGKECLDIFRLRIECGTRLGKALLCDGRHIFLDLEPNGHGPSWSKHPPHFL